MKKFKFTLQALLNVKNTMEKQQKAELAVAEARLAAFQQELEQLKAALGMQKQVYLQGMIDGELTPGDLVVWSTGFKAMRERILLQHKKIETAEGERRRIQKKLIETMKERKMLEKLREKQLEEYKEAQRAEDAAIIGDFISSTIHSERPAVRSVGPVPPAPSAASSFREGN